MSAETIAVLRSRVSPVFPMDCVKAITSLTVAKEFGWELGGHASVAAAWGCCSLDGRVFESDAGGMMSAAESSEEEIEVALLDCCAALGVTPPERPMAVADSVGARWEFIMQLIKMFLPLFIDLFTKEQGT